jgi:hypothetical protein
LGLATFFWLLNALSKNFTTDIEFNVNYINIPKDKVVLNELPKHIKIKIKGLGFDLMAYKFRLRRPLVNINLSKIQGDNKQINTIQSNTISSTSFLSYISNQLGEQIEIKEIYPDSIHFLFDARKDKIVKIIPNTNLSFKKQFQLFGEILVKPAITIVSGPASIVDTLKVAYTQNISFQNLSETITETVGFNEMYEIRKLEFNPKRVLLHIPVEKYTESSVMVKMEYINVPDSITIKAIPNEIELKFMIPLSKIASLGSAKFRAEIDYNQINDNFNHKLKVEMAEYPFYIQSLTLNPGKVEYILKKQN